METLANMPPAVALVLGLLLVVWLVLLLLMPFMIESIRASTRRTYLALEELNDKIERLAVLLERGAAKPPVEPHQPSSRPVAEPPATEPRPRRREPTISG